MVFGQQAFFYFFRCCTSLFEIIQSGLKVIGSRSAIKLRPYSGVAHVRSNTHCFAVRRSIENASAGGLAEGVIRRCAQRNARTHVRSPFASAPAGSIIASFTIREWERTDADRHMS